MADKLSVMVMGGHSKGFHDFSEMGPIYQTVLSTAGFDVAITEDRDDFLAERLADVDVVVDYTTGGELNEKQASGLLGFVKSGRGFVGIHSAADSFHNSRAYERMIGGVFLTHPPTIPHTFRVVKPEHPCMRDVPSSFTMPEELYLMDYIGQFDTLLTTEFNSFQLPLAWVKSYGCGRVLFTALGHGKEQTENEHFQKILVNGIRWSAEARQVRQRCKEIGGW
jgi:type 1 glutamine amidotransferase